MLEDPGSGDVTGRVPDERDPFVRGEVAFRLLVEAVVDYAIFLLGPDGRVLSWNLGAQRIKGYSADEIVGNHFSAFYTPEDRAAGRPGWLLSQAAELGRFEDEGWRVRQDGSRFWADVVITALREAPDQPPYAFVKITRDLTLRREAEAHERHLLAEQRARAAAEEALVVRDRFLSIASHELKTPVASLQLATESLLRAREQGLLDEGRIERSLGRILSATQRLAVLVDELLDVSRLSADGPSPRSAPVDMAALVRDVAERFADHDLNDRIGVTTPAEAWLDGDAIRLDQVITNLLENALKYSSDSSPVEVGVFEESGGIVVRVADRGIGLEQDARDRIFEAFGRGTNAEHYQGIGLGLYIAQQIVGRHGGRIEAIGRTDGPGSVFTVVIPRGDPT